MQFGLPENDPTIPQCECCEEDAGELETGLYNVSGGWKEGEICIDCKSGKAPWGWETLEYFTEASHDLRITLLEQHRNWNPYCTEHRSYLFPLAIKAIEHKSVIHLREYKAGAYEQEKQVLIDFVKQVIEDEKKVARITVSNGAGQREAENEGVAA